MLLPSLRKCELTLRERITLSWLVYRSRFGGATISWISQYAEQSRNTTKIHLLKLIAEGYATKNERGKYLPIENEHYVRRDKENHAAANSFYRKFIFNKLELGTIPPTNVRGRDKITCWVLYEFIKRSKRFKRTQTYSGLGIMFGVSRNMIRKAAQQLEKASIIIIKEMYATQGGKSWKVGVIMQEAM